VWRFRTGGCKNRPKNRDTDKKQRSFLSDLPGGSTHSTGERLRSWVEANYTHVPLREKDTGTKLEALFGAYTSANPPVHQKSLGRNKFAQLLSAVYPGIGPHRNASSTVTGLYLLR